jgi:hypothetical protein
VVLEKDGEDQLHRSCGKLEVMHRVKNERNITRKIKRRKADCIGHILRRKCLLKQVIEDNIAERI